MNRHITLVYVCVLVAQLCSTLCDPTDWPASLCLWDSPGKNTRVDCHSLLQRNFPTQGSNAGLLHHRQVLYRLSYREVLKGLAAMGFKPMPQRGKEP